jgi:hypothetical protein
VTSSTSIERKRSRLATVLAEAALLFLLGAAQAFAQQAAPQAEPQQATPAEAAAPAAPAAPPDRLGRLEQQIVDLQAMVAALESLVKAKPDVTLPQESAGGDGGQNVGNAAGLTARVDSLETQIGALTSQLELMTQQLGALEAKLGGAGAPQPLAPPQGDEALPPPPQGDDPLPELPGRQGRVPADPSPMQGRGA